MNENESKSFGFTLIELLVVVAIIAVLVAMLLPALSSARDKAKSVMCQHNLKSVGLAVQLYMDDNNGKLWAVYNHAINGEYAPFWNERLYSNHYTKERNIFYCPMFKPYKMENLPLQGNWMWFTYGERCRSYVPNNPIFVIDFNKIDWPSTYFIIGDSVRYDWQLADWAQSYRLIEWEIFYDPMIRPDYGNIQTRHNNYANFLFGDLHVEPIGEGKFGEMGVKHVYDKNMNEIYF